MIPSIEDIAANIEALGHCGAARWWREAGGVEVTIRSGKISVSRGRQFYGRPIIMELCGVYDDPREAAWRVYELLKEKDA